MKHVHVIGAGTMGAGIAQVVAQSGLTVSLTDNNDAALEKASRNIEFSVTKLHAKGVVADAPAAVLARIETTTGFEGLEQADVVIEAVFEDREVKQRVFEEAAPRIPEGALVASNTSAIPITDLAAFTDCPERFVGLHFFNPVPLMQAVEVVRGTVTSNEAFEQAVALARQLGKEPIVVNQDIAGFLLNRINLPSSVEAMRMVERGVGSVEDIDRGVKLAFGRKMGIFETGDLVGLDVTYGALMALYRETGDARWYPPRVLRRKVRAGQLGRKTGCGWYRYDEKGNRLGPV